MGSRFRRWSPLVLLFVLGGCARSLEGGGDDMDLAPACPSDCPGGVCANGACCDPALICGRECCTGASVCLFDRCVMPGADCKTAGDCPANHYCEPALGAMAGGAPDGGGCTQPVPPTGKCVAQPPRCASGQDPASGCVAVCEYRPQAGQ